MRNILMASVAALILATPANATPTFSISPSTVAGSPGQTVGWGFTVTDTSEYVVLDDSTLNGVPPWFGTYTDFTASQFVVAGPSPEPTSVTEAFDATTSSGLGSFRVDPVAAIPGTSMGGTLSVDYQLFSVDPNDPNFNPDTDFIGPGTFTTDVRVAVNAVPEPPSWVLFAAALMSGLLFLCRGKMLRRRVRS